MAVLIPSFGSFESGVRVQSLREQTRRIAVVVAALLAMTAVARAQPASPVRDLTKITLEDLMNITITTATRNAEGASGAPARVQVVTAEEVQRRGYRSLVDVLKDLPDFKVDLGGDVDYPAQITVQGSRGSDRIVLLLDGIRVSSPTSEPLPILANYPVHAARQIEIVYGPASALYGADAYSAVINVISRDATDGGGLSVGTSIGQFGLYNQTGSYTRKIGRSGSLLVAAQAQYDGQPDLSKYYPNDYQGLRGQRTGTFDTIFGPMTSPRSVSPEFSIPLSAHSIHAVVRAGGWQVMFFQSHVRASTAPPATPDNAVYNADAFNRNTLLVGAASYTRPIGRATSTSTLTLSRHELDPQSGYWNVHSNMDRSYKYAFGSMVQMEEQLSWKPAPSISMTVGGTAERYFSIPQGADLEAPVGSREAPGLIQGTDIRDDFYKLHYTNVGGFVQARYAVRPALAVTIGGRADYNSRYGATFNPRAGVVAHPFAQTTVKLLAGSAYLAPSPFQAYSHFGSFVSSDGGKTYTSPFWHVGNPDLKPQHKNTVELNVVQTTGPYVQLSASTFVSAFTNVIHAHDTDESRPGTYRGWPVENISTVDNEGDATIYGGSLRVDWIRAVDEDRRIAAHAAITVADGHGQERDGASTAVLPVGAMAPVQVHIGADVDWRRWSIAPRLSVVSAQRLLATTDARVRRTLPGYATVNVSIRRRELFPRIDAFVTVENALDGRYYAINSAAYLSAGELSGAPQNPRRITVGFDFRLK